MIAYFIFHECSYTQMVYQTEHNSSEYRDSDIVGKLEVVTSGLYMNNCKRIQSKLALMTKIIAFCKKHFITNASLLHVIQN